MTLFIKRVSYFYVILFFIGQNNFVLTNILAVNQGLGIGKFRAAILIIFILIGLLITVLRFLTDKTLYHLRINKVDGIAIGLPLILIFINVLIDYLRYDKVDFIGVAPLIECIFFSVYFFINVRHGITLTSKMVNIFSLVIFLNILFEILLYFKDIGSGLSYGAFRANVAGIEINRNPSFFYPIFAFVILRYVSLNYWVKIFYYLIFFIYILTLFYRTLYVALLFPFVVEAFRFGMSISIKSIIRVFFIVILIVTGVFFLDSVFESEFNFSILNAFTGRFTSTFTDYSEDDAQSDRIAQIPEMLISIVKNPVGMGFSGLVADAEVYNYAFYFLHPLLYLGMPFLFIYYVLYKRFFNIYKKALFSIKDRILIFCILYFLIILIFFPYMNYFTFLSILIFLIQLSNVDISYVKN
jgi:hypothetical protein